jgi:hypothetical protein
MIRTGRWISAGDGRRSPLGLKDGDLLSPTQIKALERQLQNGMTTIVSLTKNELKQTGVAIDKYYNSLAKQNGISLKEFREGTSSWNAFSQKIAGYEAYKEWDRNARAEFARQGGQGFMNFDKNNPYAEYRKWGTFRVDKMGENSYNELVGLIKQQQNQQSQMYSTIGQAYRTVNRAEGITVRGLMGGGSGGRGGGGGGVGTEVTYAADSIAAMEKRVQELTKKWREAGAAVRDEYKKQLDEAKMDLDEMMGKTGKIGNTSGLASTLGMQASVIGINTSLPIMSRIGIDMTSLTALENRLAALLEAQNTYGKESQELWQNYQEQIDDINGKIKKWKGEDGGKGKGGAEDKSALNGLSQLNGGVQNIVSGIEQLGIEIPKGFKDALGFMQGITSILTGISTTLIAIKVLQGADTLLPFFAHGGLVHASNGFVQGNHFSGDMIPAMLNSGEIVLNKAQQGNLASQLSGGGFGNMQIIGVLQGEDVALMVDRWGKRSGRGELLFAKNL